MVIICPSSPLNVWMFGVVPVMKGADPTPNGCGSPTAVAVPPSVGAVPSTLTGVQAGCEAVLSTP